MMIGHRSGSFVPLYPKTVEAGRLKIIHYHTIDAGTARPYPDLFIERSVIFRRPGGEDLDVSVRHIPNRSGDIECVGNAPREIAEADALHMSLNDVFASYHGSCGKYHTSAAEGKGEDPTILLIMLYGASLPPLL